VLQRTGRKGKKRAEYSEFGQPLLASSSARFSNSACYKGIRDLFRPDVRKVWLGGRKAHDPS